MIGRHLMSRLHPAIVEGAVVDPSHLRRLHPLALQESSETVEASEAWGEDSAFLSLCLVFVLVADTLLAHA